MGALKDEFKVVVADDEPAIRSFFRALLEERGDCDCEFAGDGAEAFGKVAASHPHLLITDLMMPRMGGEELTARALEMEPGLTVLVETGNPSFDGAVRLMRHGAVDFITKPFLLDDLRARVGDALEKSKERRTRLTVSGVVQSLMAALAAKDPYLERHSRRVSAMARSLGADLGVDASRLDELAWAGLVHDVGKIGIAENVLHKPGRLTPAEFTEIQRHPVYSADIVRPLADAYGGEDTVRAVYHHHERMDGSGYPEGIAGDAIPLFARIIAVCDSYDAMSSARPYRGALGEEKTVALLRGASGTQLDPNIVRVFLANLDRYKKEIAAYGNDG